MLFSLSSLQLVILQIIEEAGAPKIVTRRLVKLVSVYRPEFAYDHGEQKAIIIAAYYSLSLFGTVIYFNAS